MARVGAQPTLRPKQLTVAKMSGDDSAPTETKSGFDIGLLVYFGLWYLGNYYYNITVNQSPK